MSVFIPMELGSTFSPLTVRFALDKVAFVSCLLSFEAYWTDIAGIPLVTPPLIPSPIV